MVLPARCSEYSSVKTRSRGFSAISVLVREDGKTLRMRFATSNVIILALGFAVTAGEYFIPYFIT